MNGKYILGRVLGQGGFGITYVAFDHVLQIRVAVKEYFPQSFAVRMPNTTIVSPSTPEVADQFRYGAERFLEEGRILARFAGNPAIVGVTSFFEENGTAYLIMEYVEGQSMQAYLRQHGGRISWQEALRILVPVMRALSAVHGQGLLHRDVTPDNIYLTGDRVKLLDFGAARYSIGDRSHSLDVVLKAGYAPKEQYSRRGRQGPWTDVYSLAACFYAAITGYVPPESLERTERDDLAPFSAYGISIPPVLEQAIWKGLSVNADARFQSMEEFWQAVRPVYAEPAGQPYQTVSGQPYQPAGQPYQPGNGQPYQPAGQPYQAANGQPYQPAGQPYQTGSGQPYQPAGQPYQTGSGQPYQPAGQPYQPGNGQPYQPAGQPYQPGSGQPYQPAGQPYQPGNGQPYQPAGQPYQPGNGQPYQPAGQPYQPGNGQPYQPAGQPYQTANGQPYQPAGQPSQTTNGQPAGRQHAGFGQFGQTPAQPAGQPDPLRRTRRIQMSIAAAIGGALLLFLIVLGVQGAMHDNSNVVNSNGGGGGGGGGGDGVTASQSAEGTESRTPAILQSRAPSSAPAALQNVTVYAVFEQDGDALAAVLEDMGCETEVVTIPNGDIVVRLDAAVQAGEELAFIGIVGDETFQELSAMDGCTSIDPDNWMEAVLLGNLDSELAGELLERFEEDTASFHVENLDLDGDIYCGYVNADGDCDGLGYFEYGNGDMYRGYFKNGVRDGFGVYYWANGDQYSGDYQDGKRNGEGTYTWASGQRYEGEFVDGKFEGQGTMYYTDGTTKSGTWKDDEFVG